MKRLFLFLHLLLATIVAVGQNVQDDMPINLPELYSQIDEAIEQSHHFISQYEENILKTKQTLQQAASDDQRLMTLMELSQMYESFNGDSAQAYTDRAWQLARQAGYKEIEGECHRMFNLVLFLQVASVMCSEAEAVWNGLNPKWNSNEPWVPNNWIYLKDKLRELLEAPTAMDLLRFRQLDMDSIIKNNDVQCGARIDGVEVGGVPIVGMLVALSGADAEKKDYIDKHCKGD